MAIEEVTDWATTIGDNLAHHPTGPDGDTPRRISASFREMQAAIARWRDTLGGGSIGGSIADNQIAVGATTADEIEGSASLTWDGTDLATTGNITLGSQPIELRGNVADSLWVISNSSTTSSIDLLNDSAVRQGAIQALSGDIYLLTGNNETAFRGQENGAAILYNNNVAKVYTSSNGMALASGDRINFDGIAGTGNTHIRESSADNLAITVGGTQSDWSSNGLELGVGSLILNESADHAFSGAAGHGQIWLNNETIQGLMFTDDDVVDHQLNMIEPIVVDLGASSGAVDLSTAIPDTAKEVVVTVTGFSTNGTVTPRLTVGNGSYVTGKSTYLGTAQAIGGTTRNHASITGTNGGFQFSGQAWGAANVSHGTFMFHRHDGNAHIWSMMGIIANSNAGALYLTGGSIDLTSALDRIRIDVEGDTYDSGSSASIMWR